MEDTNAFLKFVEKYTDEEILRVIDEPSDVDPEVHHAVLVTAKNRGLISEEEYTGFIQSSDIPANSEISTVTEEEKNKYWKCPVCHKVVDIEYDLCWNCQAEKPFNIEHPNTKEIVEEKVKISTFNPVKSGFIIIATGILVFLIELFVVPSHIRIYRLIIAVLLILSGLFFVIIGSFRNPDKG